MTGTGNPTLHPGSLSNTSALQLGKPTTGSSTNFKGGLDEVELFKKALSGTEVLSLYNAGTAGKCRFPITSVSLQAATEGLAFAFTFTASGAQPPYQWFATGLPSWLTLSAAGVLSGTPPAGSAGNYGLSITANDSTGAKGALSVTLTVNPLPLTITTTSPLPAAKETVSYGTQLTATGGKMPYQWSGTGLPSWLSLSGAGTLSGTPPLRSAGAITFNATVGDSLGSKQSSNFVLPINSASGALTITSPAQLPQATVGAYYSQQLTASGGQPPYVWSEAFTPPGITLSSTGALSGTPTTPGDFGFTASVKDSARGVGVTLLKLPVAALPLTITTPAPIASGVLSFPYSQAFTATGGNGAIHWATAGGSALPQGFSLSADGVLSGTAINPTGPFPSPPSSISVTATDSSGASATATYQLTIDQTGGLALSAGSLAFTAITFGSNPPPQNIALQSTPAFKFGNISPLPFSAKADQAWLTLSPNSGTTPGNIEVNVFPRLAPGDYTANITITSANAPTQTVPVRLKVLTAPVSLSVAPRELRLYGTKSGTGALTASLQLTDTGSGPVAYTANVVDIPGATLNPSSGTVLPNVTAPLAISVDSDPFLWATIAAGLR